MQRSWFDWLMVIILFSAILAFFMFVQQRGITGQVVGVVQSSPACVSLTNNQPASLYSQELVLCPGTHEVDYFDLKRPQTRIECQGSLIQGTGGAAFISTIPRAQVTLVDCTLKGFEGLYSNQHPIEIIFEN